MLKDARVDIMKYFLIISFAFGIVMAFLSDDFYGIYSFQDVLFILGFSLPFVFLGSIFGFIFNYIQNYLKKIPSPETHVKCPDCREFIKIDARVCRYCGCKLIPQSNK